MHDMQVLIFESKEVNQANAATSLSEYPPTRGGMNSQESKQREQRRTTPVHTASGVLEAARRFPRHDRAATGHMCVHSRWRSHIPLGYVAFGTPMPADTSAQPGLRKTRRAGVLNPFPPVPPLPFQATRVCVRQRSFRLPHDSCPLVVSKAVEAWFSQRRSARL